MLRAMAICVLSQVVLFSGCYPEGYAADRVALSCGDADVQSAINAALDGDRILIPEGTCTWASVVIVPDTVGMHIVGAGVDKTVISGSTQPLRIMAGNGKTHTVTGMAMSNVASPNSNVLQIFRSDTAYGGNTVRIYGNKFGGKVYVNCYCGGVIDHNEFTGPAVFSTIWIFENSYDRSIGGGDGGAASWFRDNSLGGSDLWYVEDNTFTFPAPSIGSSVADSRSGGRQVFRYNTVVNANWTVHDARQSKEHATRQYEVYRNVFTYTNNIQGSIYNWGGGSGVIWGNRMKGVAFTAGAGRGVIFQNWRSTGGILNGIDPWQQNADGSAGTFCLGGPPHAGECTGDFIGPLVNLDGDLGSGYPARDQIGVGKTNPVTGAQDAFPLYFNDNYYCTGAGGVCDPEPGASGIAAHPQVSTAGLNPTHIQVNRDYYQEDSTNCMADPGGSCTGGVGTGTLVNRPASCTTGVGYWATDQGNWNKKPGGAQGQLYKCTSTNTWTLYYTPYEYPHPLNVPVASTNRVFSPGLFLRR